MSSETQFFLWVAGTLLVVNILAMLLFILFAKLPNGKFRETIRSIIYKLDELADAMENSQKRATAIQEINSLLGWRKIFIPAFLIGLVIDTEVATIRKMQQATHTPNLHKEDGNGQIK